jgi:hypothetical protein
MPGGAAVGISVKAEGRRFPQAERLSTTSRDANRAKERRFIPMAPKLYWLDRGETIGKKGQAGFRIGGIMRCDEFARRT